MWKTDDPQLTARLRKSFMGAKPQRRVGLNLFVRAAIGEKLRIRAVAVSGAWCEVESEEPLVEAQKHPLKRELLDQQLGRLGGTVYELRSLEAEIVGEPMVPLSVLGKLRHAIVERLEESLASRPARRIVGAENAEVSLRSAACRPLSNNPSAQLGADRRSGQQHALHPPKLRVLCRTLEQLQAATRFGCGEVYADFQDIRQYREAVEVARQQRAMVYLATPRIQKPGEIGIFRAMTKHGADGFLTRNLAGMAFCTENDVPFICDFSLNAANQWTVDYLLSKSAERVTASYDLNRDQLLELVEAVPPLALEVVIHQHMPMFHMEHCVFCAVLSPGTNKTNCGRPCDEHAVKLRDRVGMEHVLHADVGCRNTLYNAVPQSAAEAVPTLLARGLRDFRVELLSESERETRDVIRLYQELLAGKATGKQVWQRLQASNRVGVTRGTLEERRDPLAIL